MLFSRNIEESCILACYWNIWCQFDSYCCSNSNIPIQGDSTSSCWNWWQGFIIYWILWVDWSHWAKLCPRQTAGREFSLFFSSWFFSTWWTVNLLFSYVLCAMKTCLACKQQEGHIIYCQKLTNVWQIVRNKQTRIWLADLNFWPLAKQHWCTASKTSAPVIYSLLFFENAGELRFIVL